jgi:hypothetical protein
MSIAHANTLIITRGPVCSGMGSYLSNAIKSVDSSYESLSQIDVSNMVYYRMFDQLFPKEMAIIANAIDQQNISYAITNNYVYFKETAYEQQKQQALDAIAYIQTVLNASEDEHIYGDLINIFKYLVMADLAYHAACKHNVIFEGGTVFNFDDEAASIKDSFDTVIETITYCPPTAMIGQWQQKNTNAMNEKKAYNRRLLKQVLQTFFNNFVPTADENQAVVMLTKDEFDTIIAQAAEYIETVQEGELGENGTFTRTEFTLEQLTEFKDTQYQRYNFDVVDYVALVPVLSYDVLLSSKEDCLNLARRIANGEF